MIVSNQRQSGNSKAYAVRQAAKPVQLKYLAACLKKVCFKRWLNLLRVKALTIKDKDPKMYRKVQEHVSSAEHFMTYDYRNIIRRCRDRDGLPYGLVTRFCQAGIEIRGYVLGDEHMLNDIITAVAIDTDLRSKLEACDSLVFPLDEGAATVKGKPDLLCVLRLLGTGGDMTLADARFTGFANGDKGSMLLDKDAKKAWDKNVAAAAQASGITAWDDTCTSDAWLDALVTLSKHASQEVDVMAAHIKTSPLPGVPPQDIARKGSMLEVHGWDAINFDASTPLHALLHLTGQWHCKAIHRLDMAGVDLDPESDDVEDMRPPYINTIITCNDEADNLLWSALRSTVNDKVTLYKLTADSTLHRRQHKRLRTDVNTGFGTVQQQLGTMETARTKDHQELSGAVSNLTRAVTARDAAAAVRAEGSYTPTSASTLGTGSQGIGSCPRSSLQPHRSSALLPSAPAFGGQVTGYSNPINNPAFAGGPHAPSFPYGPFPAGPTAAAAGANPFNGNLLYGSPERSRPLLPAPGAGCIEGVDYNGGGLYQSAGVEASFASDGGWEDEEGCCEGVATMLGGHHDDNMETDAMPFVKNPAPAASTAPLAAVGADGGSARCWGSNNGTSMPASGTSLMPGHLPTSMNGGYPTSCAAYGSATFPPVTGAGSVHGTSLGGGYGSIGGAAFGSTIVPAANTMGPMHGSPGGGGYVSEGNTVFPSATAAVAMYGTPGNVAPGMPAAPSVCTFSAHPPPNMGPYPAGPPAADLTPPRTAADGAAGGMPGSVGPEAEVAGTSGPPMFTMGMAGPPGMAGSKMTSAAGHGGHARNQTGGNQTPTPTRGRCVKCAPPEPINLRTRWGVTTYDWKPSDIPGKDEATYTPKTLRRGRALLAARAAGAKGDVGGGTSGDQAAGF